ncbi:hypothetical protein I907_gp16 [Bacillus phage Eoghan]|uniref:Uncharacterized protein n=2 Tax=Andromedavirus TaxID=1623275 RepID=M1IE40_9CAUD|nr:hypothetical protein I907_gp16 [Bacillus phage Eoghan]YP_009592249.1 hypothetical protein FDG68_gp16 [Bacillus phage Taylor]AGE60780.1 hypothetical protein EOGHAN_16 [Bacillus phage Eoghan]AGE60934.1 hypothetical protein TAYLOR_16 [Bacillus phage Taylor]
MKYKTLEENVGKVGVQAGSIIEIEAKEVADKLIKLKVIEPVKEAPKKEEKKEAPKKGGKKKEDK